jgi:hypothetical protein
MSPLLNRLAAPLQYLFLATELPAADPKGPSGEKSGTP